MNTANIELSIFLEIKQEPVGYWSKPTYIPDVHGYNPSFFFNDSDKVLKINIVSCEDTHMGDSLLAFFERKFNDTKVIMYGNSTIP